MKSIHHFYWLFLLFALSGFTNQKKEIKVTSLGNCGYLYETWNSDGVKRITDLQPKGADCKSAPAALNNIEPYPEEWKELTQ